MKNIISYFIVILSLLSYQLAQAQSCESGEVKLSELKFLGESYTKVFRDALGKEISCKKVAVKPATARNGVKACGSSGVVVNPGNPQYIGSGHGDLLDNTLGYFFCVNASGSLKKQLCTHMKGQLSTEMDINWDPKSGSDGDCLCKTKGAKESAYVSCPVNPDTLKVENQTGCTVAGAVQEGSRCVCENDKEMDATKPGTVCPGVKAAPVSPTATVKEEDFADCFTEIESAEAACSKKGQDAFDKCSKDAPETNKNISEAQRVLSIGLDAMVAQNAGSGALESCAKMSAAGTGVIEALSLFQKTCKKELEACKQGCADVKAYAQEDINKLEGLCKAKYEAKNPGGTWSEEHKNEFAVRAQQHKKYSENIDKFCKGDAQVAEGQFDDMLGRLAQSVQKADICKCQLTMGNNGKESCDSVVSPLTCMQNLNQPGCSYSSVGCPPGSTDPKCASTVRQINPQGSGVAAPISGFAGPGFSSSGGGSNAGKVKIDDSGLSGLYDETRPTGSGTATADAGSPFAPAAAAGSPGANLNMGGGDGAGNGAGGEGGEKGGLSGFFQNAKGAISSMFGGGGSEKGSPAKTSNGKGYKNDVNGFRPKAPALRGMANAGEFGGKNRDIWKIMNQRYNDQYHTFITVETPSK
ncbi:MAG: hypothetical protein NDI63_10675 [Pseudobdellovibrio sp.]|nr:hypothetical protein [Pseudobdellovibrio sp.]